MPRYRPIHWWRCRGRVTQGKTDDTYGWDNEYGSLTTELKPFKASKMLVSNAEFFHFIAANGYNERRWWDDEGWGWREFAQPQMPTFWVGDIAQPDDLRLRLMTEEVAMPWDWPAEVNQLEAAAFCRWLAEESGKAIQLPCEAEWMQLREQVAGDQPDWIDAPGNINLARWASSCPVDHFTRVTSSTLSATSGSGPPRRPTALKASGYIRCMTISPRPPLTANMR